MRIGVGGAAIVVAAVGMLGSGAQAQRATSSPSVEDAAAAAEVPPPPPGFPAPLGGDVVFGGELETHLQSDFISASGSKPRLTVFNDSVLSGFLNYRSWASLNTEIKFERNRFSNLESFYVDRNSFFRSEGLTLRQLYATLRPLPGLAVYGGKIHPAFGSAYERAPGQFYNFGTDYEQDERIGLGAEYALPVGGPGVMGLDTVRVSAEAFYLDTSDLSRSYLSSPSIGDPAAERGRRFTRGQFGPSNTGSLDSVTLSVRGGREGRGLAWQISFTEEATREPGASAERGFSVGGSYDPTGRGIALSPRLGLRPFVEYARFSNYGTVPGLDRDYAIAGLTLTYGKWEASGTAGLRRNGGVARGTDHQENISVAYEVIPQLQVGAGFNFINLDGRASRALSPVLNYKASF